MPGVRCLLGLSAPCPHMCHGQSGDHHFRFHLHLILAAWVVAVGTIHLCAPIPPDHRRSSRHTTPRAMEDQAEKVGGSLGRVRALCRQLRPRRPPLPHLAVALTPRR